MKTDETCGTLLQNGVLYFKKKSEISFHGRPAKALQFAVKKLRRRRDELLWSDRYISFSMVNKRVLLGLF
jgi:hypothetical protein